MSLSIIDPASQAANPHQNASFWLDVSDKLIKFVALLIGGAWTWMNFKRSRTYAKKLDLQLAGTVFQRESLFVEITATIKNAGASRHSVQQRGTTCEILAVRPDLTEVPIRLLTVFEFENWIEPGESISDLVHYRIDLPPDEIIWLRVNLRIVSEELEWNRSCLIRIDQTVLP
jgi:hypothetical protein